mgnify:CR=1 FL=1
MPAARRTLTRRLLRVLLGAAVSVSLLSTGAPVRALTADGFTYTVDSGNATITGCDGICPRALDIPDWIDGHHVTAIEDHAFDNELLANVSVGNYVERIGAGAFMNNLIDEVLYFGERLEYIGVDAFSNNRLAIVEIPNTVTTLGSQAFSNNLLTSVTIGESVTSIPVGTFSNNRLTSVVIPDSVTIISADAFSNNRLTSVTIGNSVRLIGADAFSNNRLTSLVLPDSVRDIYQYAFSNNRLSTVVLPKVSSIGADAFSNNRLTSVTIPHVVEIGDYAFANNGLTSVTIGDSGVNLPRSAFYANPSLASVTIAGATLNGPSFAAADKPSVPSEEVLRAGETITSVAGIWVGYPINPPTLSFSYQWYACTSRVTAARATVPSSCRKIFGATRSTFRLTAAQRNKYVTVLVSAKSGNSAAIRWLAKSSTKIR